MDFQNEEDLKVQKILSKKVFNGKTLYLVKWKNYPLEQATWQCNKLLNNVKDKIRQFKYSKRGIQQLPDIKVEDETNGAEEVKDSFKRKRGRPPKLNRNSYRQGVSKPNQIQNKIHTKPVTQQFPKRGRGRPRGSKNKALKYQVQPEQTSDSEPHETLSNSNQSQQQISLQDFSDKIQANVSKKGQKYQKKMNKLKGVNESSEILMDIVDSSEEGSKIVQVIQNQIELSKESEKDKTKEIPNPKQKAKNISPSQKDQQNFNTEKSLFNQSKNSISLKPMSKGKYCDKFGPIQELLQQTIQKLSLLQQSLKSMGQNNTQREEGLRTDKKITREQNLQINRLKEQLASKQMEIKGLKQKLQNRHVDSGQVNTKKSSMDMNESRSNKSEANLKTKRLKPSRIIFKDMKLAVNKDYFLTD